LNFITEALNRGANCIIADKDFQAPESIAKIIVKDAKDALAKIANNFYGNPSGELKVIGITGTNGKTTVSYLLEDILNRSGRTAGLIGTINYRSGGDILPAKNTTPGILELSGLLQKMVADRCRYAVIEVSSHSLDQRRTEAIDFSVACFTNLSQDHLDYHKSIEDYFLAKAKLFEKLLPGSTAVINKDDPYAKRLINKTQGCVLTYGINNSCDVRASRLSLTEEGTEFMLDAPGVKERVRTRLLGRHNVYNLLAAWAVALSCGIDAPLIKMATESFTKVPGRLETIDLGQDFKVFVDYAHTEDALKNVLNTLRELCKGRIIAVFGCGGDRDKDKRPKMAKAASELADIVIATSDNPRGEEPEAILRDMEEGFSGKDYLMIKDREQAIRKAISLAGKDDFVLIAGKGHETYQIFKDRTIDFYDGKVAQKYIKEKIC
jgi:UDP-N-acetylmuramoyl-L-alanyl-D-glutamate--2,6-diaminopimelate ligase